MYKSLFQCRVRPLCLGIVINHLTECDVVDIIPAPNLHIKLAVEDAKLKCVHETTHFQLTENSMELEGGEGEEGLIIKFIYDSGLSISFLAPLPFHHEQIWSQYFIYKQLF